MTFKKKNLGLAFLSLSLVLVAGLVANAGTNKCGSSAKSTSAAKAGCTSSQMAGCTAAQMEACCSAKGAHMKATQAGPVFPEGTKVTRVEVPGGMDLIFTGRDVPAIQTALNAHMASCGDVKGASKSCGGRTCSVTSTENGVLFSIRGPNPQECCVGLMAVSEQAATPVGSSAKGTSSQARIKKS